MRLENQYLRKRLTPKELRGLHVKVVNGIMAASQERRRKVSKGFEETGPATAFAGEEVDW